MCTEFNLKIDESTELLDTRTFDNYDTNELLQLSDAIKQSCFEFLFSSQEDNAINVIIVNECSLIVQII